MDRRQFSTLAGASLGSLLTRKIWAEQALATASSGKCYFALIADTHIIDNFYVKGSENGIEDNESILVTTPRLIAARDLINSLNPSIEQVFLIGDYFHNYPSTDYDFYFKNTTRLDNAKAITDGFYMPVHLGFGNHDYDVRRVPGEMSHRLFKAKFNADPHSVLDHKGYKFIHLNNFLGSTQDHASPDFNPNTGSLGEEQLQWFQAQLQQRKPTFFFIHFPLIQNVAAEFGNYGLHPLLRKYQDNIQLVVCGHLHKWIDFAHTYGPQHYAMVSTRYPLRCQRLHAYGSRYEACYLEFRERRAGEMVRALQQPLSRSLNPSELARPQNFIRRGTQICFSIIAVSPHPSLWPRFWAASSRSPMANRPLARVL